MLVSKKLITEEVSAWQGLQSWYLLIPVGGLQCNTAPFSWKLVFESDYQLFEMIMSACSAKEEMEWRTRLTKPKRGTEESKDSNLYTSLDLDLKSLGIVFSKPGKMKSLVKTGVG